HRRFLFRRLEIWRLPVLAIRLTVRPVRAKPRRFRLLVSEMPVDRAKAVVPAGRELREWLVDSIRPVPEQLEGAETRALWSPAVSRPRLQRRKALQRRRRKRRSRLMRNLSRFWSNHAPTIRMKRERCVLKVKCCFAFCSHQPAQRAFSK